MNINFWLNGVNRHAEISPDTLLIDFLRKQGCFRREKRLRNCELWSLHSSYGRSSGAFLQYTCSPH